MKALILNCTLKPSPEESSTEMLAKVVGDALESQGCEIEMIRVVDKNVLPGVTSESAGDGDGWPEIYKKIRAADILIMASPTWVGHPSSIAQRVIERMDGMISETDDQNRPVAYNKVLGVVVTGNEDGAHHVISEICGALGDVGFTVAPQAWTYWNKGPGPGDDYKDTEEGHEYAAKTGKAAASNIVAVARALKAAPIPAPPS